MKLKPLIGLLFFVLATLASMLILDIQRIKNQKQGAENIENNKKDTEASMVPIDEESGLVIAPGMSLVKSNCLGCHSGKIISQNRGTENNWRATIAWMQKTQNLWDLGENEDAIIKYLSTNYAPQYSGRRKGLGEIKWYELDQ